MSGSLRCPPFSYHLTIIVSKITNQSTGYCPKPDSWNAIKIALDKIGINRPEYFSQAFEFRFCTVCKTKNLIKEEIYECAVCLSDLDLNWNIDKIGRIE